MQVDRPLQISGIHIIVALVPVQRLRVDLLRLEHIGGMPAVLPLIAELLKSCAIILDYSLRINPVAVILEQQVAARLRVEVAPQHAHRHVQTVGGLACVGVRPEEFHQLLFVCCAVVSGQQIAEQGDRFMRRAG